MSFPLFKKQTYHSFSGLVFPEALCLLPAVLARAVSAAEVSDHGIFSEGHLGEVIPRQQSRKFLQTHLPSSPSTAELQGTHRAWIVWFGSCRIKLDFSSSELYPLLISQASLYWPIIPAQLQLSADVWVVSWRETGASSGEGAWVRKALCYPIRLPGLARIICLQSDKKIRAILPSQMGQCKASSPLPLLSKPFKKKKAIFQGI